MEARPAGLVVADCPAASSYMWEKPLRATARGFIHTPCRFELWRLQWLVGGLSCNNLFALVFAALVLLAGGAAVGMAVTVPAAASCEACGGILRKRLSPSFRLRPACHRGVLRREVEPDPSLRSASRFLGSRIRRPRELRCNRHAPYVFGPGLLGDVEKLPSYATCAATRHARPAPSVIVRRTSALDARVKAVHDETGSAAIICVASPENGARQSPKTPLFGLSRDRGAEAITAVVQFFVMTRDIGCIGILCCTAAKSGVLAVCGRRCGTTEHERRELPALTGFSGPSALSAARTFNTLL